MERRRFLRMLGGAIVALPIGTFFVHCGGASYGTSGGNPGDGGSTSSNPPAAPPLQSGSQIVYSSSVSSGHFHTFGVDTSAFTSPPSSGVSGDTSSNAGHTHQVSVSAAELMNVDAGQSVEVTTSTAGGHTHVFTFLKLQTM